MSKSVSKNGSVRLSVSLLQPALVRQRIRLKRRKIRVCLRSLQRSMRSKRMFSNLSKLD